MKKMM